MNYLTWIISIATITQIYFAGNKVWWAWLITIFNQILWLIFIIGSNSWGLLPLNAVMVILGVRNCLKWFSEARAERIRDQRDCQVLLR